MAAATADAPGHDVSRLALVSGSGLHQGIYVAVLEIAMSKGSHTYWKMPGDAGVPPVVSFAGSGNLRDARLLYPAPRRITEAGLEAFGYLDRVAFPIEVTPADPGKPVDLHVDAAFAVCNTICIPAHATASAMLAPSDQAAPGAAATIDAALAAVPRPATPEETARLAITPEPGTGAPTWTLAWRGADAPTDIFADAPEGDVFTTRRIGPATWRLVAEETKPAKAPIAVALTLARPAHSLVIAETLDTPSATR